jgi:3-hydroxyisobutyrate dehydrogenase-like beta-hydroxyacid dehydrogenase
MSLMAAEERMDVGFIGLGKMGIGMARNLAKAGYHVKAWNRTAAALQPTQRLQIVPSVRDALQSPVVFTMLADDAAIREVLESAGFPAQARRGTTHVVSATISVDFAEELRVRHAAAGVSYVSAPVFGRPDAAEAGQLAIVAAGAADAIAPLRPLFDALGRKTWVIGEDPKQANAVKVAGNMMIAMAIEAMSEASVIAGSHNVSIAAFLELMTQTLFGGRVYEAYGPKIAKGEFEPGFKMKLGLKDLRLATQAASTSGQMLPMLDAVRDHMSRAVEAGLGERDWSAVAERMLRNLRP